jgi:hypothetical protein
MWQRHRPHAAARPFNGCAELFGLTLRFEHPLPFGRGVVLPLPHEALLMRLEVGDALPDQLALGLYPRFGATMVRGIGASTRRLFANAVVSSTSALSSVFQSAMANSPMRRPYRAEPSASMLPASLGA